MLIFSLKKTPKLLVLMKPPIIPLHLLLLYVCAVNACFAHCLIDPVFLSLITMQ